MRDGGIWIRRNVLPSAFEKKARGQIETPVVVAKHAKEWPADRFDGVESLLIAIVPQMPDLVGLPQFTGAGGREPSVGVGNYGDEHGEF